MFIISKLIQQKIIFKNHSIDLSKYDPLLIEYYNIVIREIPKPLKTIMPLIYQSSIKENNFELFLQKKFDELISKNEFNGKELFIVENYFNTYLESYKFWSSSENGGLNGFKDYSDCLILGENITYKQVKMNDNDWPDGATTPDWANDDVIGAVAGSIRGGGWGALIWGVASSIMSAN